MSRSVFFLVAGCALVCSAPLAAQDAVLGQIYGKGVHAYFGQDYVKAHEEFTSAIDGHSQDPRCYYFRGLTLLKLGRPQDAQLDFQRGAKLESAVDPVRAFNVARSLERVQGSDRSALEQYRLEARMAVLKRMEDERRLKYDEGLKEQRAFLQRQSEAVPARPVESPTETVKPEVVPSEPGKRVGTVPATAPPADPFDTGKPAEPKKEDAAASPAKPEAEKPEATKPAGDTGDPFGGSGDEKKPAGGAKPNAEKPEAAKPAGDTGDPFGGSGDEKKPAPATPAEKPEATTPAGDGGDPFGGGDEKKPAAKPPGDAGDPFGGGDEKKPAAGGAKDGAKAAEPGTPAHEDNPFIDEPEKKPADATAPAKKPADEKKPDDEKKPADTKKPGDEKKPAIDDPFGG